LQTYQFVVDGPARLTGSTVRGQGRAVLRLRARISE
jgi:hypothetical protein